ncbi:MAG: adenosylhomocysteinase [Chlamydiia bacterium]|nr:adenosylhomocysteinase [Chlamydiia bacterium]
MDYKVSDHKGLGKLGKEELKLTRQEMPGLLKLKERFEKKKPLKGARIAGSLHMTLETAVLIETLVALGAEVRWSSCNALSTHDPAAHAIKDQGIPVFAWKGESEKEYWWCIEKTLEFKGGPNLLIDDGADLTVFIHENYPKLLPNILGVSEETTTGLRRLRQLESKGKLEIPVINVAEAKTKKAFDNYYGSKESFIDGLKRALNPMIAGKVAVVAGYGEVGKGCADGLKAYGAHVIVTEADPVKAYLALMDGFEVMTMEKAAPLGDLFVTATGCFDVISSKHFEKMKEGAILSNMGHFDTEIDVKALKNRKTIKPGVEVCDFKGKNLILLAEGKLLNLGLAKGHPPLVMSNSFSCQLLAQIELFQKRHKNTIYPFPEKLDKDVAEMHLKALGGGLTKLTQAQKAYLES